MLKNNKAYKFEVHTFPSLVSHTKIIMSTLILPVIEFHQLLQNKDDFVNNPLFLLDSAQILHIVIEKQVWKALLDVKQSNPYVKVKSSITVSFQKVICLIWFLRPQGMETAYIIYEVHSPFFLKEDPHVCFLITPSFNLFFQAKPCQLLNLSLQFYLSGYDFKIFLPFHCPLLHFQHLVYTFFETHSGQVCAG